MPLSERGALWNSSIIVAKGITLLGAFDRALPEFVKRFGVAWLNPDEDHGYDRMATLITGLPNLDLSRDLLASSRGSTRVPPVPPCGSCAASSRPTPGRPYATPPPAMPRSFRTSLPPS